VGSAGLGSGRVGWARGGSGGLGSGRVGTGRGAEGVATRKMNTKRRGADVGNAAAER